MCASLSSPEKLPGSFAGRTIRESGLRKRNVTVRLNINLATKPYQDVRRVLLQWGPLVLLLAVCTVALAWTAVSAWRESREVNAKINALQSEIAALDGQRKQAIGILQLPQNSAVVDNSKFLNGLIARKSFSWTRVFMQLEEIMPPRLHVVSIAPALQPDNTVEVHMTVAGTSREAAVELVKRLEQSPSFRSARITEESEAHEKESLDTVKFQLTAVYVPLVRHATEQKAPVKVAATKGGGQ
jgi:type IV pilus assembly protein PilN